MSANGLIDRIAGIISPSWLLSREKARAQTLYYQQASNAFSSYNDAATSRISEPSESSFVQSGRRHLTNNLKQLRDKSRHLERNNYLASSVLNASVDFKIGSGTRIEPSTSDQEWNTLVEKKWEQYWFNGLPEIKGDMTGPEIERMVERMRERDGDVGISLLKNGQIQVIPGDWIATPYDKMSDMSIVDGCEINEVGRIIKFWIRNRPLDQTNTFRVDTKGTPIDARNFIFLKEAKDIDEVRGQPVFSALLELFSHMDNYVESVIVASRIAACFGVLIREAPASGAWMSGGPRGLTSQGDSVAQLNLEPGMIKRLGPNDEVTQLKPEQPNQTFDSMMRTLVRFAGMELAIPLELTLLDFSGVNYSSSRSLMNTAKRSANARYTPNAKKFLSRVYRWKVSKWVKDGEIPQPKDEKFWEHSLCPDPHQYVDIVKEIEGEIMQHQSMLKTRTQTAREHGRDFANIAKIMQTESSIIKETGLEDYIQQIKEPNKAKANENKNTQKDTSSK